MEREQGTKAAIQDFEEEFSIKTYSIVTVREIIDTIHIRKRLI